MGGIRVESRRSVGDDHDSSDFSNGHYQIEVQLHQMFHWLKTRAHARTHASTCARAHTRTAVMIQMDSRCHTPKSRKMCWNVVGLRVRSCVDPKYVSFLPPTQVNVHRYRHDRSHSNSISRCNTSTEKESAICSAICFLSIEPVMLASVREIGKPVS